METHKPSGLGRGLAGILGDALATDRAPEVSQLLGVRQAPEVRKLAVELALAALAEGFGASGVVVASRSGDGPLAAVASRLPEGWSGLDRAGFEVAGRLWAALCDESAHDFVQLPLEDEHLLICRQQSATGPLAAAVVRPEPFAPHEQRLVARLVRSVALAVNGDREVPTAAAIRVLAKSADDGVLADVRLVGPGDRRHAAAVGPDEVNAVAAAAAELCDLSLGVIFAGRTRVQSQDVTIVVATDGEGPLFGLAVTDPASGTGAVEAVFNAAMAAGADPFASVLSGSAERTNSHR
ncbi:MAG: hypothetical protein R2733_20765 [Acidimicrobiales bacterium]